MTMALYERMTLIGVGLLGGSLALAARDRGLAGHITGFGRNAETLRRADRAEVALRLAALQAEREVIFQEAEAPASARCRRS